MPQKDEAVIDVGDMGFLHIQRQLQLAFQKGTALLADGLGMGLRPFDDDDEVIGIAAIGYSRFPLAVLSNRDRTTLLNAEVPRPTILPRFLVQVFRLQPAIKLMEHDVGQERRQNAALRNTFTSCEEQATVNVTSFEDSPEQINESQVPDATTYAFQEQPMVDSVEVARQITFDDPAALRVRAILQLHPHGANRMMNAAFRTEAIGTGVEVALPDRLHGHQHRPLDDAVQQDRYTQWSQLAIGLRDTDALDRCRTGAAVQQGHSQPIQMTVQISSKSSLVHSVKTRCIGAFRRQYDPGRLSKPIPVGDEPEQSIKPAGLIGRGPRRELVLHFTDYQRSSPR